MYSTEARPDYRRHQFIQIGCRLETVLDLQTDVFRTNAECAFRPGCSAPSYPSSPTAVYCPMWNTAFLL